MTFTPEATFGLLAVIIMLLPAGLFILRWFRRRYCRGTGRAIAFEPRVQSPSRAWRLPFARRPTSHDIEWQPQRNLSHTVYSETSHENCVAIFAVTSRSATFASVDSSIHKAVFLRSFDKFGDVATGPSSSRTSSSIALPLETIIPAHWG